ncbi:MAG: hypothetical protein IT252_06090 [Chitinophagaceae bacterium]|nr:hypothetical protein [Chitinophagaceae bacterium]
MRYLPIFLFVLFACTINSRHQNDIQQILSLINDDTTSWKYIRSWNYSLPNTPISFEDSIVGWSKCYFDYDSSDLYDEFGPKMIMLNENGGIPPWHIFTDTALQRAFSKKEKTALEAEARMNTAPFPTIQKNNSDSSIVRFFRTNPIYAKNKKICFIQVFTTYGPAPYWSDEPEYQIICSQVFVCEKRSNEWQIWKVKSWVYN